MIKVGFSYYVINPQERKSAKTGKSFWAFDLRDAIVDGGEKNKYQYYGCCTFSPVIIPAGKKIRIDGINSIVTKSFNDKSYFDLVLDVTVQEDIP